MSRVRITGMAHRLPAGFSWATRWPGAPTFGGWLDDPCGFDPAAFGISAYEAARMDPQHRLLLMCAREAVDDAGLSRRALAGSRTGVWIAMGSQDWAWRTAVRGGHVDAYSVLGNAAGQAAGRVAGLFDLRGPAVVVDAGCAATLVAIDAAARAIRSGALERALVGAAQVVLAPDGGRMLAAMGVEAEGEPPLPFDPDSPGSVRGEGVGVLVLEGEGRAARTHGWVRACAVAQAGADVRGGVPTTAVLADVMRTALQEAGVPAADIGWVEAHGTGAPAADQAELAALRTVYPSAVPVGSVKGTIGHLEAAAGLAGLVAALGRATPETPIVSVNTFGMSGTVAHLVIERPFEVMGRGSAPQRPEARVVGLSAATSTALMTMAKQWADALAGGDADGLARAAARRPLLPWRLAVAGRDADSLATALRAATPPESPIRARPRVGFLYTGQGAQEPGMGRALYAAEPTFRAAFDAAEEAFRPLGVSVVALCFGGGDLRDTRLAQPALFALQYALTCTWAARGLRPDVVVGHSIGELAAAVAAGALTLPAAARLVAARADAMGALPSGGAMLAVLAPRDAIVPLLADLPLDIAVENAPRQTVVAGSEDALATFEERLEDAFIASTRLRTSHAFHSRLQEPCLPGFLATIAGLPATTPAVPWISTATASPVASAPDAAYWAAQLRGTVRFHEALAAAPPVDLWVEIGPGDTLVKHARATGATALPSLPRGTPEPDGLATATATLFRAGADVLPDDGGLAAPAPAYPFELRRFGPEALVAEHSEGNEPPRRQGAKEGGGAAYATAPRSNSGASEDRSRTMTEHPSTPVRLGGPESDDGRASVDSRPPGRTGVGRWPGIPRLRSAERHAHADVNAWHPEGEPPKRQDAKEGTEKAGKVGRRRLVFGPPPSWRLGVLAVQSAPGAEADAWRGSQPPRRQGAKEGGGEGGASHAAAPRSNSGDLSDRGADLGHPARASARDAGADADARQGSQPPRRQGAKEGGEQGGKRAGRRRLVFGSAPWRLGVLAVQSVRGAEADAWQGSQPPRRQDAKEGTEKAGKAARRRLVFGSPPSWRLGVLAVQSVPGAEADAWQGSQPPRRQDAKESNGKGGGGRRNEGDACATVLHQGSHASANADTGARLHQGPPVGPPWGSPEGSRSWRARDSQRPARQGPEPTEPAPGGRRRADREGGPAGVPGAVLAGSLQDGADDEKADDVVIVALATRLPGTPDLEALAQTLHLPRVDLTAGPDGAIAGRLDEPRRFDAAAFGISRREAARMDPRQGLALELAWEALERSGLGGDARSTGVFVGVSGGEPRDLGDEVDPQALTGRVDAAIAGRVAYALGLEGPALGVDAACASSLVAVHLAADSVRRGECAQALVGGVQVLGNPHGTALVAATGALSPTGRARPFDADADGFVRGEGGAFLVLTRRARARALGLHVCGTIVGSAVGHGGGGGGFAAPDPVGQERVLRAALGSVDPRRVAFVEAHGTGTRLGDPVEAAALAKVYGGVALGSGKARFGHLEPAAGVVGLVRLVLAMAAGRLPAQSSVSRLHPEVARWGHRVPDGSEVWPTGALGAVSAVGMTGTIAHVVVAPPERAEEAAARANVPLAVRWRVELSARSPGALRSLCDRWAAALAPDTIRAAGLSVVDVAWTALHRKRLPARRAVVASTLHELRAALIAEGDAPGGTLPHARSGGRVVDLPIPAWGGEVWTEAPTVAPPVAPPVAPARPAPVRGPPALDALLAELLPAALLSPDVPLGDLGLDSLAALVLAPAVPTVPAGSLRNCSLRALREAMNSPEAGSARPPASAPGSSAAPPTRPTLTLPDVRLEQLQEGRGVPIVLLHPGGIAPAFWERLDLGDRPVWLGRSWALEAGEGPSVAPYGVAFAAALGALFPGPVALCGWSVGGVVAWEAAASREAAGGDVPVVVLLDTYGPGVTMPADLEPLARAWSTATSSSGAGAAPRVDLWRQGLDASARRVDGWRPAPRRGGTLRIQATVRHGVPVGWEAGREAGREAWVEADHYSLVAGPALDAVGALLRAELARLDRGDDV